MDILIKNMELPKKYGKVLIIYHNGVVEEYNVTIVRRPMGHSDSVAIPLPEHNDLADKSVIIERMGDAHDELWDKVDKKALSECHVAFLKAVMQAPVVLEASI